MGINSTYDDGQDNHNKDANECIANVATINANAASKLAKEATLRQPTTSH